MCCSAISPTPRVISVRFTKKPPRSMNLQTWRTPLSPTSASVPRNQVNVLAQAEELRVALRRTQRSLKAELDRANRNLGGIRERASDLRLLPARTIFPAMERTARDAAVVLKKRVRFETIGSEHRLDAHVLLALRDALCARRSQRRGARHRDRSDPHRNRKVTRRPRDLASSQKRAARSFRGRRRRRRREPHAAIQDSLIAKRLLTAREMHAMQLPEATQLLFQGGVSTATEVSEVMGRGIGLDVVRTTVARLKGEVTLRSEPARGTTVEMRVPVTLESTRRSAGGCGRSACVDAVRFDPPKWCGWVALISPIRRPAIC